MRRLSATQLFDVWERGLAESPAARALSILAASEPASKGDELSRLTVGRRDAALLRLRTATFGPELKSRADCSSCGETLEWTVDSDALVPTSDASTSDALSLDADGLTIQFRPVDAGDLVALASLPTAGDVAELERELLARCVSSVRRGDDDVGVGALTDVARRELVAALSAADPLAEMRIAADCPACGTTTEALLDVPSFLWTEIDAWVSRTARDVHALASAYGWRESDVLAMSPARRRLYSAQLGT